MKPRRGSIVQAAWWFDADQSIGRENAKREIKKHFYDFSTGCRVILGPIEWEEVDPLSPRVPEPPKHFQGNIKAMIGTATVVEEMCQVAENRLTNELKPEQLHQMRLATRRAWAQAGGSGFLTDEECEEWINREGPSAAVSQSGTIH